MTNVIPKLLVVSLFYLLTIFSNVDAQILSSPTSELKIARKSSFHTGEFDQSAAEIVAWHASTGRIFFTKASSNELVILSTSGLDIAGVYKTIDLSTYGGGVNSVAINGNLVAVAVEANTKQENGIVVFFNQDGIFQRQVQVGALPDMVTFTKDGKYAITANEGEPNADYSVDPEGSVSIISTTDFSVQTANFNTFDAKKDSLVTIGVRIYGPNASVSQDLEPEYVAVNAANTKAYISLQENNALAVVDIATATVENIFPLGFKDYSLASNKLDASDRDNGINIRNWPVFGMYQPDAITTYEVGGKTYVVSANEGDAREYDTFEEEARLKSLDLDPSIFNRSDLKNDENLGRLTVSTALSETNDAGQYTKLYTLGARSFSIWDAETGLLVWDSGDQFERLTAQALPTAFNANNDDNDSFESRSDNKGPEPEAVSIGVFNGRTLAFIGLERVGGFMVYDIGNPEAPQFLSYVNNRNFEFQFGSNPSNIELQLAGDLGIEDIKFIDGIDSPTGNPFLLIGNEVSGNVSIYEINVEVPSVSIADANLGQDGDVVTVQGIVTSNDYGFNNAQFFVQDETGGINVYWRSQFGGNRNSPFVGGTEVKLTGKLATFRGQRQLEPTSHEIIATGRTLPEPKKVIRGAFNLDSPFIGQRITLSNLWLVEGQTWPTEAINSSSGRNILATNGQDTLTIRIDRGESFYDGSEAPTGIFSLTGVFGVFDTPQINPFFEGELVNSTSSNFSLTLFHNNDGESQLINLGSGKEDFGGVARFKTLADQLRAEAESAFSATLFLSSGDNFLAGPEFNAGLSRKATDSSAPFYDAIAIQSIGYDALAMGNHDFDFGPDVYADLIDDIQSPMPFLSANLDFSEHAPLNALLQSGRVAASSIFVRNQEKIGVIGATTENLPFISSPGTVAVNEVAAAVRNEVQRLESEGVNKIILISHLQGIEEDSALVSQLSGIDIVIAGGGDEVLANNADVLIPGDQARYSYPWIISDANGVAVPMVTTAGNYSYIGKLAVEFDTNGNVVNFGGGPVRVAGGTNTDAVTEDPMLLSQVVEPVKNYLADLSATILTKTSVDLDADRNTIRSKETNLGNLVTDSYLWNAARLGSNFGLNLDPERTIAVANGGGIRASISAGDVSVLNTFDVLPFTNFLSVVPNITPSLLKEIMENAVSRIDAVTGFATGGGTGRFAQIAGFTVKYDPRGQAIVYGEGDNLPILTEGNKVVDIILNDGTEIVKNGTIVTGAPNVALVTADFTAKGGDQYPFRGADFITLGITYQQSLETFIASELRSGINNDNYPVGGESRIINGVLTSIDDFATEMPLNFELAQNYPNPFNPTTTISYTIPQSTQVRLAIFNMLGQKVMTLVDSNQSAGTYSIPFNATNLSTGLYVYRIEAGTYVATKKMMLLK